MSLQSVSFLYCHVGDAAYQKFLLRQLVLLQTGQIQTQSPWTNTILTA